jgi:hypothetical protein
MIQDVFLEITCDFIIVSIAIGTNQMLVVDKQISLNDYEHVCDLGVEGGNIGLIKEWVNDTKLGFVPSSCWSIGLQYSSTSMFHTQNLAPNGFGLKIWLSQHYLKCPSKRAS